MDHLPDHKFTMATLFCCSSTQPYRPEYLSHESKFISFLQWSTFPKTTSANDDVAGLNDMLEHPEAYVIQLVRQINFGPLESKRYFLIGAENDGQQPFVEITENRLIEANYEKLNA
jgi:hypothetical protein